MRNLKINKHLTSISKPPRIPALSLNPLQGLWIVLSLISTREQQHESDSNNWNDVCLNQIYPATDTKGKIRGRKRKEKLPIQKNKNLEM